ncbi:MAG: hypothetical protein JO336_19290 [Acidobacteriia bacterium]|nr:hypothetical protein [Terriglobia bacterium]MBV8904097.1 hypothetical protein [Terriglobia bacterium]
MFEVPDAAFPLLDVAAEDAPLPEDALVEESVAALGGVNARPLLFVAAKNSGS